MDEQAKMSSESASIGMFSKCIINNNSLGCYELFLFQVEDVGVGPVDQNRRHLEEEFNMQRAKMKELFLQKEGWCNNSDIDKQNII